MRGRDNKRLRLRKERQQPQQQSRDRTAIARLLVRLAGVKNERSDAK